MDSTSLKGKTAMVTGATGGIGAAICESLAADGIRLIMVDLKEDVIRTAADRLDVETYPSVMDISDPEAVAAGCEVAFREFGPVDILVNSAGILSNNKLAACQADEWRRLLAVNLDGPFYLSQQVVPHMKEQRWGRIVNICSYAWKAGGLTAGTAYTTSKGGLVSLTFSVALEFASYGITVNGIAPCYVMTPMVSEQLTEEERQNLLTKIPVGRFSNPDEVAFAVQFLVSPLSGFITGEIIDMNGGFQFD